MPKDLSAPDHQFIKKAFDEIAGRYDLLNSVLSLNLDVSWRRRAKKELLRDSDKAILDLGTGSGKFLAEFLKDRSWHRAVGVDFSEGMLEVARREIKNAEFLSADFHHLPFEDDSFDLVVSAFTLRSVQNLPGFLKEIFRVLKPGGRVGLLCLTRPTNFFCKLFFYPYIKVYLPLMGRLVSGSSQAYKFLSQSVETFQPPEATLAMMGETGFKHCQKTAYSFQAATLLVGNTP